MAASSGTDREPERWDVGSVALALEDRIEHRQRRRRKADVNRGTPRCLGELDGRDRVEARPVPIGGSYLKVSLRDQPAGWAAWRLSERADTLQPARRADDMAHSGKHEEHLARGLAGQAFGEGADDCRREGVDELGRQPTGRSRRPE